jgi:hypothetical protein
MSPVQSTCARSERPGLGTYPGLEAFVEAQNVSPLELGEMLAINRAICTSLTLHGPRPVSSCASDHEGWMDVYRFARRRIERRRTTLKAGA